MLTDTKVRTARAREKPYKLYDERGLFLLVYPDGRRGWRFKYRYGGREKQLSMGSYPDTGLKLARKKRDAARELLADDIDPSLDRKAKKAAREQTFGLIAKAWLKQSKNAPGTVERAKRRLEMFAFPELENRPIGELKASDLVPVLRKLETQGKLETAHRIRSLCSRVFRFAVLNGLAERDITTDLRGALAPIRVQHRAAVTEPRKIGGLLRAIDGYDGEFVVRSALQLLMLTFVRPGELRLAEWSEFDLKGREWRIPGPRMKMGVEHIVPLSTQAVALLENLHKVTGDGTLVFPGLRSGERPISDNSLNAALRRMGFAKEEQSAHGFRTIASTRLNELAWDPVLIELQLAHRDKNKVRDAYNQSERLPERRTMMQAWADHLEVLRQDDSNVVAING